MEVEVLDFKKGFKSSVETKALYVLGNDEFMVLTVL